MKAMTIEQDQLDMLAEVIGSVQAPEAEPAPAAEEQGNEPEPGSGEPAGGAEAVKEVTEPAEGEKGKEAGVPQREEAKPAAVEKEPEAVPGSVNWQERAEALMSELARMSSVPEPPTKVQAEPDKPPVQAAAAATQQHVAPADLITEDDYNEAFASSDGFKRVMQKVYTAAHNAAVETSLRMLPAVTSPVINQQIELRSKADSFYRNNPDLVPIKGYVKAVAEELEAVHTDWGADKLFDETEKEVRSRIKIPKAAVQPAADAQPATGARVAGRSGERRPAFAKPGSSGRNQPAGPTGLTKDIMDLVPK